MKTTIYSCVTGNYDNVLTSLFRSKTYADEHTEFVLFSDRADLVKTGKEDSFRVPGTHVTWRIKPIIYRHPVCNIRTARWHKVNSHLAVPDCDASVWIDGTQLIKVNNLREDLVEPYFQTKENLKVKPIATFKHPERTCVYQEGAACRKLGKDNAAVIRRQLQAYRSDNYPPYNGMVETACVVRSNSLAVMEFNEFWWDEIAKYSRRDQLSFNYTGWKTKISHGFIAGHRIKSPYFDFVPHKKRR